MSTDRELEQRVRLLSVKIATQVRLGNLAEADRLRTVLRTLQCERAIRKAVDGSPPLDPVQLGFLRSLLGPPSGVSS